SIFRLRSNRPSANAAAVAMTVAAASVRPNARMQSPLGITHLSQPIVACSRILRVAVEQFDRYSLRTPQETDLDAGARRVRFLGELDALFLQIGGDGIDA